MNYVYIEENEPVRLLSDKINEIYFTEEYTVTSEWEGEIPEDVLMRVLIYGYMNGAYFSRKIRTAMHERYSLLVVTGRLQEAGSLHDLTFSQENGKINRKSILLSDKVSVRQR